MPERASDSRTVDCTRAQCGRAVDRRSGLPELEGAPEARAVIERNERCQNSRLPELLCGLCFSASRARRYPCLAPDVVNGSRPEATKWNA